MSEENSNVAESNETGNTDTTNTLDYGTSSSDSILTSIKKLLGITEDDISFDVDLIIHINTVLVILNQLGVGPNSGFCISDKNDTWTDLIDETINLGLIKTYVYERVKLLFDPPQNSSAVDAIERNIKELEWRLTLITEETT